MWGWRYRGLGILTPIPDFCFWNYKTLCVQEMLRYFRIKLFPNKTTLFYRSQLHVPLYVRNRGWGSRYCGLGILTPTPDFCFWNYKKLPRPFEKGKYLRNTYYAKLHWFYNSSVEDFKTSEAQVSMGVKIPWPRYLDPHPVFLTHCAISYQDRLKKANI